MIELRGRGWDLEDKTEKKRVDFHAQQEAKRWSYRVNSRAGFKKACLQA